MPSAPLRYCANRTCGALVEGGRCKVCQRERNEAYDAQRGSAAERGYDTAWRRLRARKLLANPFCEIRTHCADRALREQIATEVDHKLTIEARPELRLVWSNLQSACKRCHSAKTMRESVAR